MKNIETYHHFYFVGIGGIGMSALARYFKSLGKQVAGYDKTQTKLTDLLEREQMNINFEDQWTPFHESLNPEDTLIVYTPAIKRLQILESFKNKKFQILKRAEVLGLITQNTECIAVAGTHGKTTTSTLVSHLCKEANLDFSCFLGGISENFKSNFLYNGNQYSVLEADEYDRSFLKLSPKWAIITSNDADHLDIYGDSDSIKQSFNEFIHLIANPKQLFVRKGIETEIPCYRYAVNEKADFYSDHLVMNGDQISFDFHTNHGVTERFQWDTPGIHNVENATAAIALLHQLGISLDRLKKGIASFKGIKRRYTKHVFDSGKIYIDDYAHHPTELNAVIGSIRAFYPEKKLLVVFQPHLFSRTKDFATDFAKSLENSEQLILLDIYPARELPQDFPQVNSNWLLEQIKHTNKQVSSLEGALDIIKNTDFDILLTVGAGNIDTLTDPLVDWLKTI